MRKIPGSGALIMLKSTQGPLELLKGEMEILDGKLRPQPALMRLSKTVKG